MTRRTSPVLGQAEAVDDDLLLSLGGVTEDIVQ